MPYHLVARARHRSLMFRSHREAMWLWQAIAQRAPGLQALCLMPDHLHLVHPDDVRLTLARALQGFARRRNAARGERGRVVDPLPDAEPLADAQKLRRAIRYVHLNPCRAGLTDDPLAWTWSTHRDKVGLAAVPATHRSHDTHAFHAYVSGDPTVHVRGTELPVAGYMPSGDALGEVAQAVTEILRVPTSELRRRSPSRRLFVRCARVYTAASSRDIGAWCGLTRQAVARIPATSTAEVRLVGRVLGDPRFGGLDDGDLTIAGSLRRYRGWRCPHPGRRPRRTERTRQDRRRDAPVNTRGASPPVGTFGTAGSTRTGANVRPAEALLGERSRRPLTAPLPPTSPPGHAGFR
jgi:REP element-mobilizing transposase RayT